MNDFFKRVVAPGQSNLSTSQLLQAGVLAGLTQQCTTLPLEVVRTRMTVGAALQPPMVYKGILDCLGTIVRTEGVFGLYVWMRVYVCGCVCAVVCADVCGQKECLDYVYCLWYSFVQVQRVYGNNH